jgi:hypothetical protein
LKREIVELISNFKLPKIPPRRLLRRPRIKPRSPLIVRMSELEIIVIWRLIETTTLTKRLITAPSIHRTK